MASLCSGVASTACSAFRRARSSLLCISFHLFLFVSFRIFAHLSCLITEKKNVFLQIGSVAVAFERASERANEAASLLLSITGTDERRMMARDDGTGTAWKDIIYPQKNRRTDGRIWGETGRNLPRAGLHWADGRHRANFSFGWLATYMGWKGLLHKD
ncbi:hypothetical protein IWZ00DRAFT_494930 [Phyllosticta capitalensis]